MTLDTGLTARALPPGSMRYYAWLFTPEQQRDVIAALFIIESELRDSARTAHEVAHIRLQWWREEFDRLVAGQAQHPATQTLQAATTPSADFSVLQQTHLSTSQELANATYETDTELNQYLHNGLGALCQLAVMLHRPSPTAPVLDAARHLGAFIRQAEIYRDLRADFHQGRLYLPLAELDSLDLEYETLQGEQWPATFEQWLTARITQQLIGYQTLKQGLLDNEKQALRPWLVLADLHEAVLKQLRDQPAVRTRTRIELGAMKKLFLSWKAARSAA